MYNKMPNGPEIYFQHVYLSKYLKNNKINKIVDSKNNIILHTPSNIININKNWRDTYYVHNIQK